MRHLKKKKQIKQITRENKNLNSKNDFAKELKYFLFQRIKQKRAKQKKKK